jgi:hypothetical protein
MYLSGCGLLLCSFDYVRDILTHQHKNDRYLVYVVNSRCSFYARSQNCEKLLLSSSCLSVHPSVRMEVCYH